MCVLPFTLLVIAAAPAAPAPPRLVGIVVAGDYRAALFEAWAGGIETVLEGEAIAGFAVRAIRPEGVELEQSGSRLTVIPGAPATSARPAETNGVTFGVVVNKQGPPDD